MVGDISGDIPTPGLGAVVAGLVSAGDIAGAVAGFVRLGLLRGAAGGAGGGLAGTWPNEVSASAVEQRQGISSFFIIMFGWPARAPAAGFGIALSQRGLGRVEKNFSSFSGTNAPCIG
jgi:hypothetical protein